MTKVKGELISASNVFTKEKAKLKIDSDLMYFFLYVMKATIDAGYSENSSREIARKLLINVDVYKFIE